MTTSNFKLISNTTPLSVVTVVNADYLGYMITNYTSFPTYIYDQTSMYVDGSDPLNIAGIGDIATVSAGTPNISASSYGPAGGLWGGFYNDDKYTLTVFTAMVSAYPTA